MSDPCDFLAPELITTDPAARERVLGQTLAVLRRRRRLRRVGWLTSLAACFAGGVFTTLALRPASERTIVHVEHEPVTPTVPEPERKREPVIAATERPTLLRQAGDHFLVADDPLTALQFYTQSLDENGSELLTASTEDSWLLLAIKDARLKEKRDAKSND